jgi:hypothetical protein
VSEEYVKKEKCKMISDSLSADMHYLKLNKCNNRIFLREKS